MQRRLLTSSIVMALAASLAAGPADPTVDLGPAEPVDAGVTLYRPRVAGAAGFPSPLAVQALVIDSREAEITTALALGRRQGRGAVADAVSRERAVAGVNAGFFVLATGDPTGVLRVDGDLLSDARLMRGAVAISGGRGPQRLTFGRARVSITIEARVGSTWRRLPLDGIDTVRRANGATLYTSRFGIETTTASGVEWPLSLEDAHRSSRSSVIGAGTVSGEPRPGGGPIPPDGAVLSYGGSTPPAPLSQLRRGTAVRIVQEWTSHAAADATAFAHAEDVVGGAGLLIDDGVAVRDWAVERTGTSLHDVRHPRTLIGTDARGTIWLVTIDGRQPGYSVGVTMPELQQIAAALGLRNALNLDGGGSTTMIVGARVVNRPSDPTGPRAVSDVLLVRRRPAQPPAARR